jgi:zinc protease
MMTSLITRAPARRTAGPRPSHDRVAKLVAALLVLGAVALAAQTLPPGVRKGATLAGITEYGYANGLRVLLLPDPGSSTITINITYLVGSRHEGYGETGMAHLLEHMNFITSTHDRNIKKELEDHGARWNGTTYYDRTNYYETVNASEENLRWALGLEAERMVNMRIEKPLLDTEMTVVRNELREQRRERPGGARPLDRVPVAQLRQVDDWLTRRHRARADRSARGLLSQVLSARQRRHHHRRTDRCGADTGRRGGHPRRDSAANAQTR